MKQNNEDSESDSTLAEVDKKHITETNEKDEDTFHQESSGSSQKKALHKVTDLFSASDFGANYMSYLLCVTFGMEAITIGFNLTITPLYILEQFDKSPRIIGIILASGSATGNIVGIFTTLTPVGKAFVERFISCPYGLFYSMGGISVSVLIAAIPIFSIHLVGLLLLMAFNDAPSIILAGMQGEITCTKAYSKIGLLGQVIRRCLNCATAITGPLLFSILPSLPYLVAGSVNLFWTAVLWIIIRGKIKKNNVIIEDALMEVGHNEEGKDIFCASLYKIFTRQEVLARLLKRGSKSWHNALAIREVEQECVTP